MMRNIDKAFQIQHKEQRRSARVMTKRAAAQLFLYKTSRRVTLSFFMEDIRDLSVHGALSLSLSTSLWRSVFRVDVRAQPQTLSAALQLEHTVMLRSVCLQSTAQHTPSSTHKHIEVT